MPELTSSAVYLLFDLENYNSLPLEFGLSFPTVVEVLASCSDTFFFPLSVGWSYLDIESLRKGYSFI